METKQTKKVQPIIGNVHHAVDDKGRVTVPARWRVGIGADLYVSPNPDGALVVMTEEEFQTLQSKALSATATEEEKSGFARYIASHTHITQMDRQGRINLNDMLLNKGGIKAGDDVVLTGKLTRFEIYNLERWNKLQERLEKSFEKVSQQIGL
jgi:MraZ protein